MVPQDWTADIEILKKMRIRELEPDLQKEIFELAANMSGEVTLTGRSSVYSFYRMYEEEKAKERKNRKLLKKAEETILRLAGLQTLHHEIQAREDSRRRQERSRKIPLTLVQGGMSISGKTQKLFESVGITDLDEMERCVGLMGEDKTAIRIELAKSLDIGHELVKKLFHAHPETLRIPNEDEFLSELGAIEGKKAVLDGWKSANKKPLPLWADYDATPGILLDDYRKISELLRIEVPEETPQEEEGKRVKYQARPMSIKEMDATLEVIGFSLERRKNEAVFRKKHKDIQGAEKVRSLTVSRPHDGEYDPITVRKIIRDSGSTPSEFEEARKKARGEI